MSDDVLLEVTDGVGRITLNRPRQINALTLGMLAETGDRLVDWLDDDTVERVRLTGAGERGLCSGADVRALRTDLAERGEAAAEAFFTIEYGVDALIANYPKPVRADLFGITMGGGMGLAAHCSERVVRADSRLAMPETIIGLFPDVGVLYELSRAPGELGTHLALTGSRVGAADAVLVGLADRAEGDVPDATLPAQRHWIDECYAGDDPVAIVRRLEDHAVAAARDTGALLRQRCPFAVAVSLAAIRRAANLPDVAAVLGQDHALAVPMVQRPDFSEGVRAQVVDKDRTPSWHPGRLEGVDPADVQALFAALD
ncbi:MAG: enoyl-CoA hydratase/isomerase family protein [Micropruina sp.]|uniref:enoyl-CoA hydratase/isomerase family protein n=1 Tax=Micropruina sp. TaxID=2737536 RepID=UPI0039E46660